MPQVSIVQRLPADKREWFDRELVRRGFAGYEQFVEDCAAQGIDISISAAHRYGQGFKNRLERLRIVTEQARAVVAESPDDEGAINEALMRLVQEQLFDLLEKCQFETEGMTLTQVARAIADLGRTSVSQKKLAAEARERVLAEQKEKLESLKGRTDIDQAALQHIIQTAYGISL